ncbi:unnamed protein product [Didymodactylos carnosus]|uniref:ETS domain-containing protein n=1 Tax=Didymodactylos carnosus TaxID=1234261 RepID=A0A814CTB5_9BILA|nr:unnamed protein product [Didymodactylos carnosus]CAF0944685.1 unnamed protein product [Didymodactylos carnosus]CAF3614109.1 unnamed protein product [Didymodactylos carnosus]CAF3720935.1 unnamed protein product [Didymodactylos carnosus]
MVANGPFPNLGTNYLANNNRSSDEKALKNIIMSLPTDLLHPIESWSKQDVLKWIQWCVEEYALGDINVNDYEMNGKALLLLNEESFKQRSPRCGDVLHKALQQHISIIKSFSCQAFQYQLWNSYHPLHPTRRLGVNIPSATPTTTTFPPTNQPLTHGHLNTHPAFNFLIPRSSASPISTNSSESLHHNSLFRPGSTSSIYSSHPSPTLHQSSLTPVQLTLLNCTASRSRAPSSSHNVTTLTSPSINETQLLQKTLSLDSLNQDQNQDASLRYKDFVNQKHSSGKLQRCTEINTVNSCVLGNNDLQKTIEKNGNSPTRTTIRHDSKTIPPIDITTCFVKTEQTDDISDQLENNNNHIKSEDEEELDVEKSPLDCSLDTSLKNLLSSPSLSPSPSTTTTSVLNQIKYNCALPESHNGADTIELMGDNMIDTTKIYSDKTRHIRYYHDKIDFRGDILHKPLAAKNCRILWEFLYILLEDPLYESIIRWENREKMIFRIIQADKLAALWGLQKNRLSMTYEKLSRGMRYYYSNNIIQKEQSKRLLYRFMRSPDEIRKSMKRNGNSNPSWNIAKKAKNDIEQETKCGSESDDVPSPNRPKSEECVQDSILHNGNSRVLPTTPTSLLPPSSSSSSSCSPPNVLQMFYPQLYALNPLLFARYYPRNNLPQFSSHVNNVISSSSTTANGHHGHIEKHNTISSIISSSKHELVSQTCDDNDNTTTTKMILNQDLSLEDGLLTTLKRKQSLSTENKHVVVDQQSYINDSNNHDSSEPLDLAVKDKDRKKQKHASHIVNGTHEMNSLENM